MHGGGQRFALRWRGCHLLSFLALFGLLACGEDGAEGVAAGEPPGTTDVTLGERHEGQYHLGPVDFAESEWHNACAPAGGYRAELRAATGLGGEWLAGVATELSGNGALCDACIAIETAAGNSLVARVVTYGTEQAAGDIDVSPSVYEALNTGEYPRSMSWHLTRCPEQGPLRLEYQTASNPWWTSLWVRNPRLPVTQVAVQVAG